MEIERESLLRRIFGEYLAANIVSLFLLEAQPIKPSVLTLPLEISAEFAIVY